MAKISGPNLVYEPLASSEASLVAGPYVSTLHPGTIYAVLVGGASNTFFLVKTNTNTGESWTTSLISTMTGSVSTGKPYEGFFDPVHDQIILTPGWQSWQVTATDHPPIWVVDCTTGTRTIIDAAPALPPRLTTPPIRYFPNYWAVKQANGDIFLYHDQTNGTAPKVGPRWARYSASTGTWNAPADLPLPTAYEFNTLLTDDAGAVYVFTSDYTPTTSSAFYVQKISADGTVGARTLIVDMEVEEGDIYYEYENEGIQVLIWDGKLVFTNSGGETNYFDPGNSNVWISNSLDDLTFTKIGSNLMADLVSKEWAYRIDWWVEEYPAFWVSQFRLIASQTELWAVVIPQEVDAGKPVTVAAYQYLGGGVWGPVVYAMAISNYFPPTAPVQVTNTRYKFFFPSSLLSDGTMGVMFNNYMTGTNYMPHNTWWYTFGVRLGSGAESLPELACGDIPAGTVGVPYTHQIAASGGVPPYAFEKLSGTLPPGTALDPATGIISGTPTAPGNYCFTIAGYGNQFSMDCESPPDGTEDHAYAHAILITGGISPYTVSVIEGALPPGLVIDNAGNITGTATTPGNYSFTVQATDSLGFEKAVSCSINIDPHPIEIYCYAPWDATVGVAVDSPQNGWNAYLDFRYGTAPFLIGISNGILPPNVTIDNEGKYHGTPVAAGLYMFDVTVQDAIGLSTTGRCGIHVLPSGVFCRGSCAFNQGEYNECFMVDVVGMTGPYNMTITSGYLPDGLIMDPATGLVSGTTNDTVWNYCFTIHVEDALGATNDANCCVNVIPPASPEITVTCAHGDGTVGEPYDSHIGVGGEAPWTVVITDGGLPPGLVMDIEGHITGTPTTAGGYTADYHVTDNRGLSADVTCGITIAARPPLEVSCNSPQGGFLDDPYTHPVAAVYGAPPYTFEISGGSLPPGLSLVGDTISGTPSEVGTFNFVLKVTDSDTPVPATAYVDCSITVTTVVANCNNPPDGIANYPYSHRLFITGGPTPYSIALVSGALPPGLNIANTGWITGTPTTAGTYPFTVRVTDAADHTSDAVCQIVIQEHPANEATCCILIPMDSSSLGYILSY